MIKDIDIEKMEEAHRITYGVLLYDLSANMQIGWDCIYRGDYYNKGHSLKVWTYMQDQIRK